MKGKNKPGDCPAFKRTGAHGMTIAIDLDGTLFDHDGGPEIGPVLPGVAQRMRSLAAQGYRIVIHTSRMNSECEAAWGPQLPRIEAALRGAGIPWDEIWQGQGKPITCHIIDDKSWPSVAAAYEQLRKDTDGPV